MERIMDILLSSSSCATSTSSSSSSSGNTDSYSSYEQFVQLQYILFAREKKNRVINFVEDVVKMYSENEFRRNFRVHRRTALKLTEQFKNSRYYKTRLDSGGRVPISAETQCLAFLWFAGNKSSYREIANLFNVSFSTAHTLLTLFLEFLLHIAKEHIKFPTTTAEKSEKARQFAQIAGIPNVIGCIDGCYIYIRKPVGKIRSTYVNRHGLISITLQGICDAEKKFIDVFIGAPSKIHDARIFKLSFISKDIPAICGDQYHLLGDAAYPLREYLLTPYKDYGNLTSQQAKYNKKHCQTRVKIENCFGLLKQRFRHLVRLDSTTVERMAKFVMGCCVLHNLCITEGDLWDQHLDNGTDDFVGERLPNDNDLNTNEEVVPEAVLLHRGQLKRSRIVNNL